MPTGCSWLCCAIPTGRLSGAAVRRNWRRRAVGKFAAVPPCLRRKRKGRGSGETVQPDEALYRQLCLAGGWQYPPPESTQIPPSSASRGLSGRRRDRSGAVLRPSRLLESAGWLTPAQGGTALHTFMQFADYRRAAEHPAAEVQRLVERGISRPPRERRWR